MTATAKIDQFTLILQPTSLAYDFDDLEKWKVESLINTFLDKSGIELIFGLVEEVDGVETISRVIKEIRYLENNISRFNRHSCFVFICLRHRYCLCIKAIRSH